MNSSPATSDETFVKFSKIGHCEMLLVLATSYNEKNCIGLKTHPRNYDITHCRLLCED